MSDRHDPGEPNADGGLRGLVDGLDAVFTVAALIAAAGAAIAWPLLAGFRGSDSQPIG